MPEGIQFGCLARQVSDERVHFIQPCYDEWFRLVQLVVVGQRNDMAGRTDHCPFHFGIWFESGRRAVFFVDGTISHTIDVCLVPRYFLAGIPTRCGGGCRVVTAAQQDQLEAGEMLRKADERRTIGNDAYRFVLRQMMHDGSSSGTAVDEKRHTFFDETLRLEADDVFTSGIHRKPVVER